MHNIRGRFLPLVPQMNQRLLHDRIQGTAELEYISFLFLSRHTPFLLSII